MTDTPVFEEPGRLLRPQYVKRMAPLVRRPREWARIFVGTKASAKATISRLQNHAISVGSPRRKNNVVVPGDPGDWEYQVGQLMRDRSPSWDDQGSGQWAVWARYVPGFDDPPEGAEIAWDESGASWVPVTSSNGSEGNTGASGGL